MTEIERPCAGRGCDAKVKGRRYCDACFNKGTRSQRSTDPTRPGLTMPKWAADAIAKAKEKR